MNKNEKISIFKDIIFNPSKAFKEINKKPKNFLLGAILLGIIVIIKDIYSWGVLPTFYEAMIKYPVYWIIASFTFYFVSWLFNKKVKFLSIFTCIGYIAILNIIFYLVGDVIIPQFSPAYFPVAGGTATVGYFLTNSPFSFLLLVTAIIVEILWTFILCFFTLKEVNKFKTGKTLLLSIIGGIIVLLVTVLIY